MRGSSLFSTASVILVVAGCSSIAPKSGVESRRRSPANEVENSAECATFVENTGARYYRSYKGVWDLRPINGVPTVFVLRSGLAQQLPVFKIGGVNPQFRLLQLSDSPIGNTGGRTQSLDDIRASKETLKKQLAQIAGSSEWLRGVGLQPVEGNEGQYRLFVGVTDEGAAEQVPHPFNGIQTWVYLRSVALTRPQIESDADEANRLAQEARMKFSSEPWFVDVTPREIPAAGIDAGGPVKSYQCVKGYFLELKVKPATSTDELPPSFKGVFMHVSGD